jgi:hypothetical protein
VIRHPQLVVPLRFWTHVPHRALYYSIRRDSSHIAPSDLEPAIRLWNELAAMIDTVLAVSPSAHANRFLQGSGLIADSQRYSRVSRGAIRTDDLHATCAITVGLMEVGFISTPTGRR